MTSSELRGSRSRREETLSISADSRRIRRKSIATRYDETLFRSRLEARWAAFFDLAGVQWEYEPKANISGWWPDFKVSPIRIDGEDYTTLAEVKPVAFSPISVDPAFAKAMHKKWTLCLGAAPSGDYIGFLVCKRDSIRTIGVRLTDEGLEGAPLDLCDYGSHATRLWNEAINGLPDAGVSAAINGVVQGKMGRKLFHFEDRRITGVEGD